MKSKLKALNNFCIIACVIVFISACEKAVEKQEKLPPVTNKQKSVVRAVPQDKTTKGKVAVSTDCAVTDSGKVSKRVSKFTDALYTRESIANGELTNITQEGIADIFQTLEDPTHIVILLKPYLKAGSSNLDKRNIARLFFEYMQENYPEERLQACAICWLGRLVSRDVYDPKVLNVRDDKFKKAVEYYERVIQLPSREYYYFPALDGLAYLYKIKGDLNIDKRKEAYAKAREYYWTEFNAADKGWIKDQMICEIFEVHNTREEAREFFNKHRDRKWSSTELKENFMEYAKINRFID